MGIGNPAGQANPVGARSFFGQTYVSPGKTWSLAITSQQSPTSLRIEPFNHGLSTSSALAQDTYWPGISSNAITRPERTPWNSGSIDPCTHGPLHNTIPAVEIQSLLASTMPMYRRT